LHLQCGLHRGFPQGSPHPNCFRLLPSQAGLRRALLFLTDHSGTTIRGSVDNLPEAASQTMSLAFACWSIPASYYSNRGVSYVSPLPQIWRSQSGDKSIAVFSADHFSSLPPSCHARPPFLVSRRAVGSTVCLISLRNFSCSNANVLSLSFWPSPSTRSPAR